MQSFSRDDGKGSSGMIYPDTFELCMFFGREFWWFSRWNTI